MVRNNSYFLPIRNAFDKLLLRIGLRKIVVVDRVVVRMIREEPRVKDRTVIIYTNDPKYKKENETETLH